MAPILSLNPGQTLPLEGPVDNVEVQVGTVLVTDAAPDPITAKIVDATDNDGSTIHDCEGSASISLYSITGSQIGVNYTHEAGPAPTREEIGAATRGDAGGTSGSYESRTVEELESLARERDISGRSKMDKSELIAALRGEF